MGEGEGVPVYFQEWMDAARSLFVINGMGLLDTL